jgi:hypothetical protein
MEMSSQSHAPTALYPRGKDPRYPLYSRLDGPRSWSGHRDQTPVVQSLVRRYTDRATPDPICIINKKERKSLCNAIKVIGHLVLRA